MKNQTIPRYIMVKDNQLDYVNVRDMLITRDTVRDMLGNLRVKREDQSVMGTYDSILTWETLKANKTILVAYMTNLMRDAATITNKTTMQQANKHISEVSILIAEVMTELEFLVSDIEIVYNQHYQAVIEVNKCSVWKSIKEFFSKLTSKSK